MKNKNENNTTKINYNLKSRICKAFFYKKSYFFINVKSSALSGLLRAFVKFLLHLSPFESFWLLDLSV